VACGEAVNATAVLDGRPVGSLRISAADLRSRHRGVSHHSLTAYRRVALLPADIAVPAFAGDLAALGAQVEADLVGLERHRLHRIELDGLVEALERAPVRLSSMGRALDQDPGYFLAAAAAGRLAARLLGPTATG
jgi:hypothetical protein